MRPQGVPAASPIILELCAGGIDDVRLAADMNADRIELNCAMALDGLTPSAGLVRMARQMYSGPIIAMLRPREGNFIWSEQEFRQMLDDLEFLVAAGVEGVAVGCLTADRMIDQKRCQRLRNAAPKIELVCHKAFDHTPCLADALEQLIDCGFQRILTSGGEPNALSGADSLRRLLEEASGRIEILAGGGIRASNVEEILTRSGCRQVHTSARRWAVNHSGESPGMASRSELTELQRAIAEYTRTHT